MGLDSWGSDPSLMYPGWHPGDREPGLEGMSPADVFVVRGGIRFFAGCIAERLAARAAVAAAERAMLQDALKIFKNSDLTNAGRALTKHPEIIDETKATLRTVLKTDIEINEAAEEVLRSIMANGDRTVSILPRYGQTITYQIPFGFGARFNAVTNEFIGFINP